MQTSPLRSLVFAILASGSIAVLVSGGCSSSAPPKRGGDSGGEGGGDEETGGKGGSTVPPGTGGRTGGSGGGGSTGTGGAPSTGGAAGGGATGTGGAPVAEDAGAPDAAPPVNTGDGGSSSFGGLGPGSADDSPPLVLPGSKLIFDGKTLMGWMCDAKWSVKDGTIDGTGSGNSFCKTADDHDTFRLTGKSRIVQDPGNHAGICFWGPRNGSCLQITPVSGSLWDYRGGGGVRTLPRIFDYTKWNFFELLVNAQTGTVDIAVNGHLFPTFTDKKGHPKGPIGLQLHAGFNEVQYKDLALEDNPTQMKLLTVIPGK